MFRKITHTDASNTTLLIRLMVGAVFLPLLIIMLVAIATTKADLLANDGFWSMLHDSRTDWAMLLGSLFLLFEGGGSRSIDQRLTRHG